MSVRCVKRLAFFPLNYGHRKWPGGLEPPFPALWRGWDSNPRKDPKVLWLMRPASTAAAPPRIEGVRP